MSNLASSIELYIKRLLEASPNATLLLQRKELAERFQCVPRRLTMCCLPVLQQNGLFSRKPTGRWRLLKNQTFGLKP